MKKLLALILVCISVNTFAITTVSGKVARIYPAAPNAVFFSLKNDQCGKGIDVYYVFILDSEIKKAWYSMILAAANTDKPISVSIPNCSADGSSVEVRYIFQDF